MSVLDDIKKSFDRYQQSSIESERPSDTAGDEGKFSINEIDAALLKVSHEYMSFLEKAKAHFRSEMKAAMDKALNCDVPWEMVNTYISTAWEQARIEIFREEWRSMQHPNGTTGSLAEAVSILRELPGRASGPWHMQDGANGIEDDYGWCRGYVQMEYEDGTYRKFGEFLCAAANYVAEIAKVNELRNPDDVL